VTSGYALELRDVYTGDTLGPKTDFFNPTVPGHDMKLYLCRLVKQP
jgi:alpha-galactosidase